MMRKLFVLIILISCIVCSSVKAPSDNATDAATNIAAPVVTCPSACKSSEICDPLFPGATTNSGTCYPICSPKTGGSCLSPNICNPVNGTCEPSCSNLGACTGSLPNPTGNGSVTCSSLAPPATTSTTNGYCKMTCASNADCSPIPGYVCSYGVCTPGCQIVQPTCSSGVPTCSSGTLTCSAGTATCSEESPVSCTDKTGIAFCLANCPPDYTCNQVTGACTLQCQKSTDCNSIPNTNCSPITNTCVPSCTVGGAACPGGSSYSCYATSGTCEKTCKTPGDCTASGPFKQCSEGFCKFNCAIDLQCQQYQTTTSCDLITGVCEQPCPVSGCPNNQACSIFTNTCVASCAVGQQGACSTDTTRQSCYTEPGSTTGVCEVGCGTAVTSPGTCSNPRTSCHRFQADPGGSGDDYLCGISCSQPSQCPLSIPRCLAGVCQK